MKSNTLPDFQNYKEENSDHGYESLQDFFLSWTLRCSMEKFKNDNLLINTYSKRILFSLLFGKNEGSEYQVNNIDFEDYKVSSVKTKRQLGGMDLIAEIDLENKGQFEKYILSIENKWYGNLGLNQLDNYSKVLKDMYPSNPNLVKVLLYCDNELHPNDETIADQCRMHNYKCTDIDRLIVLANMKEGNTGNDLFDEYWFNSSSQ